MILVQVVPVEAFEYQEQALQPLSPSDTQSPYPKDTPSQRLFAPKKKIYPFLDQLELLLYPNKNFKSENPAQRLERLEMAVFGSKQRGNIGTRLNNLQTELENWQIGNMKVVKTQEPKKEPKLAQSKPDLNKEAVAYQQYSNPVIPAQASLSYQRPASRDYNYMNYRLATPLLQNIGRRTIDAFFK